MTSGMRGGHGGNPGCPAHGACDHGADTRRIGVAFFLNFAFALVEIGGGIWTNSVAILSDALHDLGDAAALALGWHFQRLSRRAGDEVYTFGYRRFSLLSALVLSLLLLGGGAAVLVHAIPRLFAPAQPYAPGMLLLAGIGMAVNALAALRMRGSRSLGARIVTWHLVEDVLSWGAVLVAALVMLVVDVPILDPLLSVAITLFVSWNVIRRLRETLVVLLQGVPKGMALRDVEDAMRCVDGICDVHHLHVWSQDGEHHVLTGHVVVDEEPSIDDMAEIRGRVRDALRPFGIGHVTLEFETRRRPCVADEEPLCRSGGAR